MFIPIYLSLFRKLEYRVLGFSNCFCTCLWCCCSWIVMNSTKTLLVKHLPSSGTDKHCVVPGLSGKPGIPSLCRAILGLCKFPVCAEHMHHATFKPSCYCPVTQRRQQTVLNNLVMYTKICTKNSEHNAWMHYSDHVWLTMVKRPTSCHNNSCFSIAMKA